MDSFYSQFHAYARQNRMWILSRKSTPAICRGRLVRLSGVGRLSSQSTGIDLISGVDLLCMPGGSVHVAAAARCAREQNGKRAIPAQGHRQRLHVVLAAGCWLLAAGQISDLSGIFE